MNCATGVLTRYKSFRNIGRGGGEGRDGYKVSQGSGGGVGKGGKGFMGKKGHGGHFVEVT